MNGTGRDRRHEPRETIMTAMHMTPQYTPGETITVHTAKGEVTGAFVSTNSKGINIKTPDGKVVSRSLKYVTKITRPVVEGDGYTTRDLADMFNMEAKALRVHLRAMGLGVGKGRRYTATDADVAKIREHLATLDA
jgi:hypothetical protein